MLLPMPTLISRLMPILGLLLLVACPVAPIKEPIKEQINAQVKVTISPNTVSLTGNQATEFTATVTGSDNTEVTWTLEPELGQVLVLDAQRMKYTPPVVTVNTPVKVRAQSKAEANASAEVSLTITPAGTNQPGQVPLPVLESVSPERVFFGTTSNPFVVTVNGSGFVPSSVLRWNEQDRVTVFVSDRQLTTTLLPSDLDSVNSAQVRVLNPAPGGGLSEPLWFHVDGPNPVPELTTIVPYNLPVGSGESILTVYGNYFSLSSVVQWNGSERPTTVIDANTLKVRILASDLLKASTAQITVRTPALGGGTSNPFAFKVVVVPKLEKIFPFHFPAGSPAFTLTVTGADFRSDSLVLWNGSARPTTFVRSTELRAQIPAGDLSTVQTVQITVVDPSSDLRSDFIRFYVEKYQTLPITANNLTFDPKRNRLYASVSSNDVKLRDRIAVIDPETGTVLSSVFVGDDPGKLALSDDQQFLYVGLKQASKLVRVDLNSLQVTQSVNLGSSSQFGALFAEDIEVLPGRPKSVAVSLVRKAASPRFDHVVVFDDGVARANRAYEFSASPLICQSGRADTLYGAEDASSDAAFRRLSIDSNGISFTQKTKGVLDVVYSDMVYAAGRVYFADGRVVNPEAANGPALVHTFPTPEGASSLAIDPGLQRAFYLPGDVIKIFDTNTFAVLEPIQLPGAHDFYPRPGLTRWGYNGLAFITRETVVLLTSAQVNGAF
jgi:hypothetical protein